MVNSSIAYIGVNDYEIDLFEGLYQVPNGMSYNSYLIKADKLAVVDTVDKRFTNEWLSKLDNALDGRTPSYLIVQHMEPDHSGSILAFCEKYPNAKIVSSPKSFVMLQNYFGVDFSTKQIPVTEKDDLDLGDRTLRFIPAPMVHWPEVTLVYDEKEKILFSADAFGKFGALDGDEEWACEARRYYFGIVGKYGVQVQNLLKKLSRLEIVGIYPLHGPALTENLRYYLHLYDIWSSYGVEENGVVIAYTSVYGNTKRAVEVLAEELKNRGVKVVVNDLARCDMAEAVEDAFRYGKLVLATTTYNGGIFPFMREFLNDLTERNFKNRKVAFIENGSWAPMAIKVMQTALEKCANLEYAETQIKILSALTDETYEKLRVLADELSR